MSRLVVTVKSLVFPALMAVVTFAAAGRFDLPFVWAIIGIIAALYLALAAFADPDLMRERQAPGPGNQDRLTGRLGAVLMVGNWVLIGLDVGRFHWSTVPWQLQAAGVAGYAAALSVNFWAVRANRFYSSVVRLQEDRGQVTIASGPYRFVRHPGYAATLFAIFSGGIALGSWPALLPMMGFALLFVRRTLLEDRLLIKELEGYAEYAKIVRYRLIPGIF